MIRILDKEKCCGCAACYNVCPKECISLVKDEEGFVYPIVNEIKCVNCGLCEKVCSFQINEPKRKKKTDTYAVKALNIELRKNSSSGGVFGLVSEQIINDSGVVYGVSFSSDYKSCSHIRIDNISDLEKLRGSKYFQSDIGNIYELVKKDLQNNKLVLFSGVPCQINGLKMFLQKEYDNLVTMEVVCHGVPSPLLWEKYYNYLESKNNKKITKVSFRNKVDGWHNFSLSYDVNNVFHHKIQSEDPFMRMFLRDYCLRPSCYSCNAKILESMADLTVADFWGIEKVAPEMDDDLGVSLVLVQTDKGRKLFDIIQVESKAVTFDEGIEFNPAYYKSCEKPILRNIFFDDLNTKKFEFMIKKYASNIKGPIYKRALRFAKKCFKRF